MLTGRAPAAHLALANTQIGRILFADISEERTPMQQKKSWAKPKAVEAHAAMEINCYVSCTLKK